MVRFESKQQVLQAGCEQVFNFLSDFRNIETLMPEQITHWQATEHECSFTIKGLADLSMELGSKSYCSNIHIVSKGKNPINYSLDYFFTRVDDRSCRVSVVLDAELSAFLRAVASGPLQHLVDIIAQKLKDVFH